MTNKKCYDCKYRRRIPGDAHSCCGHPAVMEASNNEENPFALMVNVMSGKFLSAAKQLNIKGDPRGIHSGWFVWPANFDPVWLLSCDGFEPKEAP